MPYIARSPCDAGTVAGARLAGRPQQPPRVCAASCGALQEEATLCWFYRSLHIIAVRPYAGSVLKAGRSDCARFLQVRVVSGASREPGQVSPHLPVFLTTVSSFVPQEQEQQGNGRQHQVPPPCRLESKPQQQQLMSSGILCLQLQTKGVARLSALRVCVAHQTLFNGSQHHSKNIQLADSFDPAAQRDCTCALMMVWMACWWTCSRRQVRLQCR
jgi:hypothetical protein